MRRKWVLAITATFALGVVYFLQIQRANTPRLSRRVARRLPVANPLRTIPDHDGNYDLDGVSYDVEGVIVGGDASKAKSPLM